MLTHHLVLSYVIAFDLAIGALLFRYLWLARNNPGNRRIPVAWLVIVGLVNLSGTFCGADIEEAVAGLGGLSLTVLILSAIDEETLKPTSKLL